jgi:hypothetical protein
MACVGCDGEAVTENAAVGDRRRAKMEMLQAKAQLKRKSRNRKSSSR